MVSLALRRMPESLEPETVPGFWSQATEEPAAGRRSPPRAHVEMCVRRMSCLPAQGIHAAISGRKKTIGIVQRIAFHDGLRSWWALSR